MAGLGGEEVATKTTTITVPHCVVRPRALNPGSRLPYSDEYIWGVTNRNQQIPLLRQRDHASDPKAGVRSLGWTKNARSRRSEGAWMERVGTIRSKTCGLTLFTLYNIQEGHLSRIRTFEYHWESENRYFGKEAQSGHRYIRLLWHRDSIYGAKPLSHNNI